MDLHAIHSEDGRFTEKHGLYGHPFYHVWVAMNGRCSNENNESYHRYGGRGITVCDEWQSPETFISWLEANGYKKGLQLDRRDNDGPYSPENCRVVTPQQNSRNRRDNQRYMVHGESLMACEIEEKYGIKYATFRARVDRYGQTPEQALINKRKMPQFEWEIDGETMSAKEIQEKFDISKTTFSSRIRMGWDVDRAAKTPIRRYKCL